MRILRHRDMKQLMQDYPASNKWSQTLNPGPVLWTTVLYSEIWLFSQPCQPQLPFRQPQTSMVYLCSGQHDGKSQQCASERQRRFLTLPLGSCQPADRDSKRREELKWLGPSTTHRPQKPWICFKLTSKLPLALWKYWQISPMTRHHPFLAA